MLKRQSFIIICLITFSLPAFTQSFSGVIAYKQVGNYGKTDSVKMYFDQQKSFYVSNRGEKRKINMLANGEELITDDPKAGLAQLARSNLLFRYFIDEEGDIIYKNWYSNKLIFRKVGEHEPIIVEEPYLSKLEWVLSMESKKIGNFDCQRAETLFRGRKYIAWFTPEIPVPTGPWKLHGLPGLILEAYDETETFQYLFQSIEMPIKDMAELTKLPTKGEKVSFENYQQTEKRRNEERDRKAASQAANRGVQLTFSVDPNYKVQEIY